MQNNDGNGIRVLWARGLALGTVLVMGLGLVARPADAAPFSYVTNSGCNPVSMIDAAANQMATTVAAGVSLGAAVAQDGKHADVASGRVPVINTGRNPFERGYAFRRKRYHA